jgi:hypothetical protein
VEVSVLVPLVDADEVALDVSLEVLVALCVVVSVEESVAL